MLAHGPGLKFSIGKRTYKIKVTSLIGHRNLTYLREHGHRNLAYVDCVNIKGSRRLKSVIVTLEISGVFLGIIPPYFFLITASCKYLAKSHCVNVKEYGSWSLTIEAKLGFG